MRLWSRIFLVFLAVGLPCVLVWAVLGRAAGLLRMDGIPAATLQAIAERSRGTPRVALRLLRRHLM